MLASTIHFRIFSFFQKQHQDEELFPICSQPRQPLICFLFYLICLFWTFHVNEIMQHVLITVFLHFACFKTHPHYNTSALNFIFMVKQCPTLYLSMHLWMNILIFMNNTIMNITCLCTDVLTFFLGVYLGAEILCFIHLKKLPHGFPKWLQHSTFPSVVYEDCKFSVSLPIFVIWFFLIIAFIADRTW